MTRPTLLIDADMILYRAAAGCEREVCWDEQEEIWSLTNDISEVKGRVIEHAQDIQRDLDGGRLVMCVSDHLGNFRKELSPDYKGNRKHIRKPVGWPVLREWIFEPQPLWIGVRKPRLEADDVIGIMMTQPRADGFPERIIVSDDKDMLTVPGKFYRMGTAGRAPELFETSEAEADRNFYLQTLTGDPTDGYTGCKGVGQKTAEKIIGKRPEGGSARASSLWADIVRAYAKAGQTEEDALLNARLARILRHSDWDALGQEVRLWTPSSPGKAT